MQRLRILTWHTHGSYLYYLTQLPHDFYVLSKAGRPPGYGGRCGDIPWGNNVFDMPVDDVAAGTFDCIIFQDDAQYLEDQYRFLTPAQRRLPRIYIEHDPPRQSPVDTLHPVTDPAVLLVHVTPFNALAWWSPSQSVSIIDHGVLIDPAVVYQGDLPRGLVIINNVAARGRRLGHDLFLAAREQVPLDLVGMGSLELGGLGEVRHRQLPALAARYRFLFNPIRYTSMGLAVIEAMLAGVPIVGLATTEMATAISNGVSGYVDTRLDVLVQRMRELLADHALAARLGAGARAAAEQRFNMRRFTEDWNRALHTALTLSQSSVV